MEYEEENEEKKEEALLSELSGTEFGRRLREIRDLYQKLETEETRFCDAFHIHCRRGCGACCEHFIPDITSEEADYLAFGLIAEGEAEAFLEALCGSDPVSPACPLYRFDEPERHCSVYRYRPMICRLFGASASEDKEGHPVFRRCKWNEGGAEPTTAELEAGFDAVVKMGDYGRLLEENEVGQCESLPIGEALEKAIAKVDLLLELEKEDRGRQS